MSATNARRGARRLAAGVCLSLAGIACPVLADPPAGAASPPDTTAGSAAGAASPVTDVAPSPAEIVALRMRVGDHTARVRLGEYAYDIRGARFEPAGVAFDPGRLYVASGGAYYERGPRPSSPIAWDRIDRITVRKPCGTRGAVVGAVVGLRGMVALAVYAN